MRVSVELVRRSRTASWFPVPPSAGTDFANGFLRRCQCTRLDLVIAQKSQLSSSDGWEKEGSPVGAEELMAFPLIFADTFFLSTTFYRAFENRFFKITTSLRVFVARAMPISPRRRILTSPTKNSSQARSNFSNTSL